MKSVKLALFEPEVPPNVGTTIRTCACFDVEIILIEPFNFVLEDRTFRRAKMDYDIKTTIYSCFDEFMEKEKNRKILFTPHTNQILNNFTFQDGDILLFGRESSGVDDYVAKKMDGMVRIPMVSNCRSLNLAISSAIGLSFVLNQLGAWDYDL